MNKILFITTLLFSFVGVSQPYIPMLEEDNIWSVDFFSDPFGGGTTGIITDQISLSGTTTINGYNYISIFINGNEGSCLLREENGIVYRYDSYNNQDVIMYDFNLDVGDVFVFPDLMYTSFCSRMEFYNGPTEMEVIGISNEFIANETRKVIEFDYYSESGYPCLWIEGIGSTLGFDPVGDIIDIGYAYLVCFTKNGMTYFFNNATSCDNTTLGLGDISYGKIDLYPNPVSTTSILQLPHNANIDQIKIFGISGRLVSEETVTANFITISNMDYSSGLYFYQILSGDNVLKTEMFIVK